MKIKLLLSLLLLGIVFQIDAQEIHQIVKPALNEKIKSQQSLILSDTTETKFAVDIKNNLEKNSLTTQTKLPYPIIFVHGLNSSASTWDAPKNLLITSWLILNF